MKPTKARIEKIVYRSLVAVFFKDKTSNFNAIDELVDDIYRAFAPRKEKCNS